MYQAAKITTENVNSATTLLYCQTANVTRNSPTNPDRPGKPMLANMKSPRTPHRPAFAGQSAEGGDQPGVGAFVDDADEQEEPAGVESVGDHHHHRAVEALQVIGECERR